MCQLPEHLVRLSVVFLFFAYYLRLPVDADCLLTLLLRTESHLYANFPSNWHASLSCSFFSYRIRPTVDADCQLALLLRTDLHLYASFLTKYLALLSGILFPPTVWPSSRRLLLAQ